MNATSPFDLLADEDPRPRLAELVIAHGWGRSRSQVAYRGLITYLSHPGRNFHVPVAALPEELRVSLDGLCTLEKGGMYPATFYQQFASPFSRRYILTLFDLAKFFSIPDSVLGARDLDFPAMLAASLMQYVIDQKDSVASLRDVWASTNTLRFFESALDQSLSAATRDWYHTAREQGRSDAAYDLWQARFAVQSGDYDLAHSLTAGWHAASATSEHTELTLLSALLYGDFSSAADIADSARFSGLNQELRSWSSDVLEMNHVLTDEMYLSGSLAAEELHQLGSRMDDMLAQMRTDLRIPEDILPLPLRVFLYETVEARERGQLLTRPELRAHPSIHLVTDENAMEALAISVCSLAWGETRSSLLEQGIVQYVTAGAEQVRTSACTAFGDGAWVSWTQLGLQPEGAPIIGIEMGFYVASLLDLFGETLTRELWHHTTLWGGSHSIKGAMQSVDGMDFEMLESQVRRDLEACTSMSM